MYGPGQKINSCKVIQVQEKFMIDLVRPSLIHFGLY